MHIFLREIRSSLKSFLIWGGCTVLLIFSILAKYSGLSSAELSVNDMMKMMPKAIQILMGGGAFDLTTIGGYYGVTFGYLQLIAALYAVLLGAGIIAKEERDKTVEFLLTKPVSRRRVLVEKLLAALLYIVLFTTLIFSSSIFGISMYSKDTLTRPVFFLCLCLFLLQLIFAGLGALMAAAGKQPRRSSQIGMTIVFGAYFLSLAIQFSDALAILRPLTPMGYFDAASLLKSGGMNAGYTLFSILIAALLCTAALYSFKKRDMKI